MGERLCITCVRGMGKKHVQLGGGVKHFVNQG